MKLLAKSGRSALRRARSALGACLALALFLVPFALAANVSASISGDTVNYSATGLAPDSSHSVKIQDGTTGSSTTNHHTSTTEGTIPQSTGSTGGPIEPGTTVTVTVFDKHGNPVGSTSVTKPHQGFGLIKGIVTIIKIITPFL